MNPNNYMKSVPAMGAFFLLHYKYLNINYLYPIVLEI